MLSTTAIFEEHLQYCNFCRAVLTLPIAISVSVFFLTITIGHVLKNRDPSFSYLLVPIIPGFQNGQQHLFRTARMFV